MLGIYNTVLRSLTWLYVNDMSPGQHLAVMMASLVTVVAILVGGCWTYRHRRGNDADSTTNSPADDRSAAVLVAADDIGSLDNDEAQNLLDETLKPQKYDPLEFWNHIQAQVKKMMQKTARRKLEEQMTAEQRARERAVQRSQVHAISRLVSSCADLQPVSDVTQVEMIKHQLKMYIE